MSEVRGKATSLNLNYPIAGSKNSSQGFRDNTRTIQEALFKTSDEITKLQATRFLLTGDGSGVTNRLSDADTSGGDPQLPLNITLADIHTGAMLVNTDTQDFQLAFDSKGRVTTATVVSHTLNLATGHAIDNPIEPLADSSGSVKFPTFNFDARGRLKSTGIKAIKVGLTGQSLTQGSLILGDATNTSVELLPPTSGSASQLVANGSSLAWKPIETPRTASADIRDFKQDSDPDWTLAFQRALLTGKSVFVPLGTYLIRSWLVLNTPGQQIFGEGVSSIIRVDASFNMSLPGVIVAPAYLSESGVGISNIQISFYQPDSANRADMIHYPWAFSGPSCSRLRFGGVVRISGAWNGVDLMGNVGGLTNDVIEIGSVNRSIQCGDALDTCNFGIVKLWPFGFTTDNLYEVYSDGEAAAIFYRVDGMAFTALETFRQRILCYGSADGLGNFGTIAQLHLDGRFGRLEHVNGRLSIATCYASTEGEDDFEIEQSGGLLLMGQLWIFGPGGDASGIASDTPLVHITQQAEFSVDYFHCDNPANGQRIFLQDGAASVMRIDGGRITKIANMARPVPMIDVQAGRCTIDEIRPNDKGTGSGSLIRIAQDDWHYLSAYTTVGWALSLPTSKVLGTYLIRP
jgi:hypothetical protein